MCLERTSQLSMRVKFHKKTVLSLTLLIGVLLTCYYFAQTYVLQSSIARYKLVKLAPHKVHADKKHILFWTNFFDIPRWGLQSETSGEEFFKSLHCPATNCILTHNKELLSEPHMYDAIVFHTAETWVLLDLPKTRSPHQHYVMATLESPVETKHNLALDHDFFNLTMTYRLDSDVVWTYAKIVDINKNSIVAPSKYAKWREPESVEDNNLLSFIKSNKKKAIAWFVSHCNAFSERDKLAEQIKAHIDIDIYGKCGKLKCPNEYQKVSDCDAMLNSTYLFYLSFENSLCVDYVTEKIFRIMSNYVVPVVLNGAVMSNFLPPKSYIDVNDFESVGDLVKYLNYLASDKHAYMQYFWWKKYYRIDFSANNYAYCDLCLKLNELNSNHKKQFYSDISQWWYADSCTKMKIKL